MAADPPLAIVVALDFVAARLARVAGPTFVACADPLLRAAVEARIDADAGGAGGVDRAVVVMPLDDEAVRGAARRLAAGGVLAVVAPGPLGAVARRLRSAPRGPAPVWSTRLRDVGLHEELRVGVGGPSSFALAAMVRAATRADRPDLADRFEVAYRRSLAPRAGARLAELLAVIARRPA